MALPRPQTAWSDLSRSIPGFHERLSRGDAGDFVTRLGALPALTAADLATLAPDQAELLALDVFMVDAVVRRHALDLDPGLKQRLAMTTRAVAEQQGCEPILSYPYYIRKNPTDLAQIRRFTATEAEFRFIRMHRLIEDVFDGLIVDLEAVLDAPDRHQALAEAYPKIADAFRRVNRTVDGFRDPQRMPSEVFHEAFRPYFGPLLDPETGAVRLEGPSGLQSPTFRAVCMLMGYRDIVFDGWTERIGHYHPPETRRWLASIREGRDAGRCVSAMADELLGSAPGLPHFHPAFGAHLPDLATLAEREGFVNPDVAGTLDAFGLQLGAWPAGAPDLGDLPPAGPVPEVPDGRWPDLARLAKLEAMLLGFHLEHVAITAVQIGYETGTGGTSGVEFLLLATFRRAFPWLWVSGLGRRVATGDGLGRV